MVSHQGGSASNIEVFLGNGSQSLMLGTALVPSWLGHANVREPAMVQYQGGALKATLRRFPGLEVKLLCQALNECSAGHAMPMCASQPWCYTKGALRATLRRFPGVEVKLLCHANVREPAMVPYQGGSASNIEAFLRM